MNETVRRGGKWTPEGFLYELSGGDWSLDFVNTVDLRPTESPKELLATYEDVASWARQAGVISRKVELSLKRKAAGMPKEAERARRRIVRARECLSRVVSAVVDGRAVSDEALDQWNRLVRETMAHLELAPRKDGLAWRNAADSESFDFMLWPVIHAAATLLTGPDVPRIRRCASEKCDWMFLDRSKRGNRRWCDMTVCGNRAKAQRFYRRTRKSAPS